MELPTSEQTCPILPVSTLLIISAIQSQRLTVRTENRAIGSAPYLTETRVQGIFLSLNPFEQLKQNTFEVTGQNFLRKHADFNHLGSADALIFFLS